MYHAGLPTCLCNRPPERVRHGLGIGVVEHLERAADPVPLAQIEARSAPSPFLKVSVTGTFLPDDTAFYGAEVRDIASGPAMDARMIEPLRASNGELILVDRGWAPLSRPAPLDQPSGVVTVSGYVRPGDRRSWFSVNDDTPARRFFTLDPMAIADAIGLPDVRPFVLVALAAGTPSDHWPDPARHLPRAI